MTTRIGDPCRVTDPADPRLAGYRHLSDAELRRGLEDGCRLFVAEGRLAAERLLQSSYRMQSLLVADNRHDALIEDASAAGVPVYVASRDVLSATVGFDLHRGVVALGERPLPTAPDALVAAALAAGTAPLLAVLEGVNDHENLGALFRNAAAFGVAGVLLDPTTADPLYRRSVRVSLGHVLSVPFARAEPWSAWPARLRAAGFLVVGLSPERRSVSGKMSMLRRDGPTALLLGAEGPGLSPAARAAVDVSVAIPMAPGVDSLNVATAAAIAFHHRQAPDG